MPQSGRWPCRELFHPAKRPAACPRQRMSPFEIVSPILARAKTATPPPRQLFHHHEPSLTTLDPGTNPSRTDGAPTTQTTHLCAPRTTGARPEPCQNPKISAVQSDRGYSVNIYHDSPVNQPKSMRRQCRRKYAQRKIGNSQHLEVGRLIAVVHSTS